TAATGALTVTLTGTMDVAAGGAFSLDDRRVLLGSGTGHARIWDVDTGEVVANLGFTGQIRWAAFSRDRKFVVTSPADSPFTTLWNAQTGRKVDDLLGFITSGGGASTSMDHTLIVTPGADGSARIWSCKGCPVLHDDLVARARQRLRS